ncbi:MAG: hypothetical protein WBD40_05580 [Tepidisphaeraceae bacterium]
MRKFLLMAALVAGMTAWTVPSRAEDKPATDKPATEKPTSKPADKPADKAEKPAEGEKPAPKSDAAK